jgi:ubiquinone/menaquinone biosynthesis C-methylase UbiE
MDKAEEKVSEFYNTVGWETDNYVTEDAKRFEDLRECSKEYISKCRLRVLRHIPDDGEYILDMASGPIQYKEYLDYSKNFKRRYCVDLSSAALEIARQKIGDHGVFLHGSFFDIPLDENFFDCAISLHTIYHMDKDKQEEAVRKLLYVTKIGKKVIIVYSNPNTILTSLPFRLLKKLRVLNKSRNKRRHEEEAALYFYRHPVEWWKRFGDTADVDIFPWRSFSSDIQKRLTPDNKLGRMMFAALFSLEERFPIFFVKHFQYPMIVLTKKGNLKGN